MVARWHLATAISSSSATNRNEHPLQLLFVPLESIILLPNNELTYGIERTLPYSSTEDD